MEFESDQDQEIFTQNLIYIQNLSMLYCPIRKNLNSQMLVMLARFLHNQNFEITKSIQEFNNLWYWRLKGHKNFTNSEGTMEDLFPNSTVVKFAIIRDPIDRFISAYLQFCHLYPQCDGQIFNRCGSDPICILNFIASINSAKNWTQFSEEDQIAHFAPQYRQCYFRQYWNQYKILKFDHTTEFRQLLREQIISQGVSRGFLDSGWGVNKTAWLDELTKHQTSRFFAEKRAGLLNNVTFLQKAYETYVEDYQFFKFPVPKTIQTNFWRK